MSQTDNSRSEMPKQDSFDLDRELAAMAGEIPPMPADFHERWIGAIRKEQEENPQKAGRSRHTVRGDRAIQVRRLAGIAAVFVLLIGGTLIYRASKREITPPESASLKAASKAVSTSGPELEAGNLAAGAVFAENDAATIVEDGEVPMLAMYQEETEEVWDAAAQEDADRAAYPVMTAAESPVAEGDRGSMPEETEEPPQTETSSDFWGQVGAFFEDMGGFLRTVWPYLLGILAIAGTWAFWRYSRNQEK